MTVAICAATLALVRRSSGFSPDTEVSRAGASTLSATVLSGLQEPPTLVLAAKEETAKKRHASKGKSRKAKKQAGPEEKAKAAAAPARAKAVRKADNDDDDAEDDDDEDVVPLPVRKDGIQVTEGKSDGKSEAKADAKPEGGSETAAAAKAETPPKPARPAMPEPQGRLEKADADRALAPLLSFAAPGTDLETLKDFVRFTYREEYSKARPLIAKLGDPVMQKFARWYFYRAKAPETTAQEIMEFVEENPSWPDQDGLKQAAEDALFWREQDPQKIIAFFDGKRPMSGTGKAALGGALIEAGRKDEGVALVSEAWRRSVLTPAIEKRLRKLHVLTPDDHRARVAYLLLQNDRSYLKAVKRILPLIDTKWRASVKARIATVERSKSAGSLLSKLENDVKNDPGVLFARIQYLRRANKDTMVWSLLRSAPKSEAKLIDPAAWWAVRDSQVRLALNAGHPKTAYALAKDHGEGLDHSDLSDAEFLAGWIALRFLGQAEDAREHFLASAAAGGLPKRRARAGYWLGRAEMELKNDKMATARFAEAAQHDHTFYGQLAHQMIASTDAKVTLRNFVNPTEQEIKDFLNRDIMKAVVIAYKADFDNLMSVFLFDLARRVDSAPEMVLACELALRTAPRQLAVRMAKVAMNRDFPVEHYAYPEALPEFKSLDEGQSIDPALVHALTRQESEFNPQTVSAAGAVGLMQLLPSTAKMVAGWYDLKFEKNKLAADPGYNVSLGTSFLYKLINNYDGSYIMALAGYNAGPGRIRQWVQQFGDPRESTVDPIDWIERIPFNETHDYVHKILESAQIYRSRLHGDKAPLRLAEDLYRGRKDKPQFMTGSGTASN
ncbi:MAG TPA: lytic transglycosylase domain-containing protein [Hyphomicrobiales bacterium]